MKVYVTGLGCISGIGLEVAANIQSLRHGKHGMGQVTLFPTNLQVPVSEVKLSNADLKVALGIDTGRTVSRTALLGMCAAKEALVDSGIDAAALRVGLISSTSVGGMDLSENFYLSFRQDAGKGRLRDVVSHDCGHSTERIARYLGLNGFTTTISTACSSASNAIMLGARLIRAGYLDAVIAGGTDSLCKFTLNGFNSLMILDKEHCRPFDHSRAGLNLGEGAGYLVLQSEKLLNREPYCELTGYANINEAYHQTGSSPDGDGPYKAMLKAIEVSGVDKERIDYINAHGTGTPSNDLAEGMALRRIFGDKVPAFSSVKAFIGHTLGASEGIEAVYSALSVHKGYRYPNLNFGKPVEETGLMPVVAFAQGTEVRHVLSNSFGFGGSNSSLLFSKTI